MSCSAAATMPIAHAVEIRESKQVRGKGPCHLLPSCSWPFGKLCAAAGGASAEYSGIARPVQREDAAVLAVHADAAREPCHDDIPAGQRGR